MYSIKAKRQDNLVNAVHFVVEEYVLPRFEVTVKTPKDILVTDSRFSVSVCAR